ncbi:MAG: hypothetical protein WC623_22040 [Pedobacter sp.]|uniref:hypothetical protein n=1 Tax=Pedobacter sp. TaxID=1411316 RepID=UPI003566DD29
MINNLLKTIHYKQYDVRYECFSTNDSSPVSITTYPRLVIKSAFTKSGQYIGDTKFARFLFKKGIQPEFRTPSSRICSIGFNVSEQKWYGWRHRAIVGFGIGDKIFESNFGDDDIPYTQHGTITITDLVQAKQASSNFAEYVN